MRKISKPPYSKLITDKNGRECYLSGLRNDNGKWIATIRYIDDGKFTEVSYEVIKKYL